MSGKLRNCCITINNYKDEHIKALKDLNYRFIIIGDEIGENGTKHLQVYLEMQNPIAFTSLTKKLLKQAHIENRKGTPLQARDYCAKEVIMFEDGELSNQGKRSDIDRCVELIKDGNTLQEVAKIEPGAFIRMHRGLKAYKSIMLEPRDWVPEVHVLWGPTGTGKSHTARERLGDSYYVWTPARGKWWDGYEGQENIIFEEFRGEEHIALDEMLVLLDKYEAPIEYKGGTTTFRGRVIYITSPKRPKHWYKSRGEDKISQLLRRITTTTELIEVYDTTLKESE